MPFPIYSSVARTSLEASVLSGGLRVGLTSAPPGLRLSPHAHRHANLLFVMAGGCDQRIGGRRYLAAGDSVLEKDGEVVHSDRFGTTPSRLLFLEVLPERLPQVRAQLGLFRHAVTIRRGPPRRLLGRLAAEVAAAAPAPLAVEALAIELLVAVSGRECRPASRRPRWLDPVLERLDGSLAEPPGLGELAREAGTSSERLLAGFRKHVGETPIEWVRRRRVEEAAKRIAAGHPSLAELAAELGFSDQPHLTRCFRSLLGTTPAAYRRRSRS